MCNSALSSDASWIGLGAPSEYYLLPMHTSHLNPSMPYGSGNVVALTISELKSWGENCGSPQYVKTWTTDELEK